MFKVVLTCHPVVKDADTAMRATLPVITTSNAI
jgi:hypothetical protein